MSSITYGDIQFLTGNSGGAVGPFGGNVNLVGDGTTINIVGNPGTSTLTVSASGTGVVSTLTGSSGGAVSPTAGNINIFQGTGITVVGNPGTSTLTISATGTTNLNYRNVNTSPYVVAASDEYLSVDCSGGAIQINLPNAPSTGRVYIIKDRTGSASTNNITVTTVGGTLDIDGATSFVMNTNFESIQVIFNGASVGTVYEVY